MGLSRTDKTPCGFCFVEYYTHENALECMKYVNGTKLDDRIVRTDLDPGFKEGRQFGRGRSGGQVRDEYRQEYDEGRGGWGHMRAKQEEDRRIQQEENYEAIASVPAGAELEINGRLGGQSGDIQTKVDPTTPAALGMVVTPMLKVVSMAIQVPMDEKVCKAATTEDLVVVTMVDIAVAIKAAIVVGIMVVRAAGIKVATMAAIAVVTTEDTAAKATMVAIVADIMEATLVGASMGDLMEVSMEDMVVEEATMEDTAAEGVTMEDMAGRDKHKDYSKYSKSSIFVPNDWHFQNNKAGVADLVARVAQHVDKQFTKSMVSIAHDPHGMFKSDGRGFMGHSGARARVGSKSIPTICPRCQSQIVTLVKRRPDAKNALATAGAVALSLILDVPKALLPLALLPMQLKSLHKISHYCPRCNYKLGKNIKISIPMDEYHD
ncbi:nuclear cap binding complex subunit [Coemansia sp. S100]|nr:nuclear cap binding complex subunit [Coemansia sp. S100]